MTYKIDKNVPLPENLKRNLYREKAGNVADPRMIPKGYQDTRTLSATRGGNAAQNTLQDINDALASTNTGHIYHWVNNVLKGHPLIPKESFPLDALKAFPRGTEREVRNNPFCRTRQPRTPELLQSREGYDWTYPEKVYGYDLMGSDSEAVLLQDALVKRTVYCITELLQKTPTAPQMYSDEYSLGLDSPVYANLGTNPWTIQDCLLSAVHGKSLYMVLRARALKPVLTPHDNLEYAHRYPYMSPRCAVEAILTMKVRDIYPLMCKVAETEGLEPPRDSRNLSHILSRQLYHPNLPYERGPERGVDLPGVGKKHRRAMVRHLLRGEPLAEARMLNEAYEHLYLRWVNDFRDYGGRLQTAARKHLTNRAPGYMHNLTDAETRDRGVQVLARHLNRIQPFLSALADFLNGDTDYYEATAGLATITERSTGAAIDELLRNMWLRILVRLHFKTHTQLDANELVIISLMTGVPVACFLNYLLWEETTWEIGDLNTNIFPDVVDVLENLTTFDPDSRDQLVAQIQEMDAQLAVRVADRATYGLTDLVLRTPYPLENL